jgi:hypothetical protein
VGVGVHSVVHLVVVVVARVASVAVEVAVASTVAGSTRAHQRRCMVSCVPPVWPVFVPSLFRKGWVSAGRHWARRRVCLEPAALRASRPRLHLVPLFLCVWKLWGAARSPGASSPCVGEELGCAVSWAGQGCSSGQGCMLPLCRGPCIATGPPTLGPLCVAKNPANTHGARGRGWGWGRRDGAVRLCFVITTFHHHWVESMQRHQRWP